MRQIFILLSLIIALTSSIVVKERIRAQYECERPNIESYFERCMEDSDIACGLNSFWSCSDYQWTEFV